MIEHEDDPNEETIMLTRRMRRERPESPAAAVVEPANAEESIDDLDENTVIVDERTVVVDRSLKAEVVDDLDDNTSIVDERTVVVDRTRTSSLPDDLDDNTSIVDERTVVVDRTRTADAPAAGGVNDDVYDTVRVLSPPTPVVATETPAIYKPRAAPRVPSAPPALSGDVAPTRVTDAVTASVVKASRRRSLISVAAAAVAGVVSVVGLVILGIVVFGG